jgi:lysophospholipid acyltransferase (LPLAT)-like uncharacterized protein
MNAKTFWRKIGAAVLPPLGYVLMRFFWLTSKKTFHIDGEITPHQHVVVCWHGELLCSPQAYRKYHPHQKASGIISRHFDGEIIARILGFFSIRPLRGSSSKGAKQVLLEAFRALKEGDDLLVTPDGPRGPRHHISDGAIALARKAGLPIMAVNYIPSRYWQVDSWDKFVIPKPFAKLDFYITIVRVDGMELEEARTHLREAMLCHTVL